MTNKCRWLLLMGAVLVSMSGTAQLSYDDNSESVVGHASQRDSLVSGESSLSQTSAGSPRIAVKTNLLYDVAVIPNIGVELSLGHRWTVAADWFYTWFSSDNRHRYWQGYGGYFTVRRYFGRNSQLPARSNGTLAESVGARTPNSFTGHHLGLYALGLTYDVEWGGRGYQAARFGFGGGVEYGYSAPIGRRLLLDFSLGVGFQDGEYKTYDPMDGHYVWQSTHKRHWFGPTKAEVSLKWLLGKKGGVR